MPRSKKTNPPKVVLLAGTREDLFGPLSRKFSSEGYHTIVEKTYKASLATARTARPVALVVDGRSDCASARALCSDFKLRIASAVTVLLHPRPGRASDQIDVVAPVKLSPAEIVRLTADALRREALAGVVEAGVFRVDHAGRKVFFHGKPMPLTSTEYDLLCFLIKAKGYAVSRSVILRDVWGYPPNSATRTLDMLVCRLRSKMGDEALRLETVYRMGYRLRTELCL